MLRDCAGRMRTAFIAPRLVSMDSGFYYEISESARFADELGAAHNVVVLLPGERLVEKYDDQNEDHPGRLYTALALLWDKPDNRLSFVISDPKKGISRLAEALRKKGATVFFDSTDGWHLLESGTDAVNRIEGAEPQSV